MSYFSKSQSNSNQGSLIWPGFVDVLASTLMVIIFIVLLFTVAQVYLGDLVVGKNEQIPLGVSIWIPLIIVMLISTFSLVRINEK